MRRSISHKSIPFRSPLAQWHSAHTAGVRFMVRQSVESAGVASGSRKGIEFEPHLGKDHRGGKARRVQTTNTAVKGLSSSRGRSPLFRAFAHVLSRGRESQLLTVPRGGTPDIEGHVSRTEHGTHCTRRRLPTYHSLPRRESHS
jgi:hypothetical protein